MGKIIQFIAIRFSAKLYNETAHLQYSTMQCSMQYNATYSIQLMICNTIQYNTIQYNTIQYNTIQYIAMQCNAMQCNAMQCNAMQCNTTQDNARQYDVAKISQQRKK